MYICRQVEVITRRWEELSHRLEVQCELHEESSDKFNSFTTRFTSFCNWLSEVHSQLQDEVCVAIPDRATADTITVHRARLEVRYIGQGNWRKFRIPDPLTRPLEPKTPHYNPCTKYVPRTPLIETWICLYM